MRGGSAEAEKFVKFIRDNHPESFTYHFMNMSANDIRKFYMEIAEATIDYMYKTCPDQVIAEAVYRNTLNLLGKRRKAFE